MSRWKTKQSTSQMTMPGMLATVSAEEQATCCNVSPGQEVLYLGNVRGGPHYGVHGVVRKTLLKKAVVDMGPEGTWNVPYYLLGLPRAA